MSLIVIIMLACTDVEVPLYLFTCRVVPLLQLFLTQDDLTSFIESTTHIVGSKRIIPVSTGILIFIVG